MRLRVLANLCEFAHAPLGRLAKIERGGRSNKGRNETEGWAPKSVVCRSRQRIKLRVQCSRTDARHAGRSFVRRRSAWLSSITEHRAPGAMSCANHTKRSSGRRPLLLCR